MRTLTQEEFKKLYGEAGLAGFAQTPQFEKKPNYFQRVGSQIKGNIQEATQSQVASQEGRMNPLYAGANIAKNVSGAILAPVGQLPGFKQMGEAFGTAGQAIVDTPVGQKATDWLSKKVSPETLGAVSDVAETGLNVAAIYGTAKSIQGGVNKIKSTFQDIKNTPPEPPGPDGGASANIMNRVARLKPSDATRFKDITGKTHGEYLTETKNFGAPDKIISNEAVKFTESMNAVDAELGKLPGRFQSAPMLEALKGLVEKVKKTSGGGVRSPYADVVADLVNKYKSGGLIMAESNILKRLYESRVKLGYNKLMNADKVEFATNIDSQLRNWQLAKARELGFKNIDAMNKQTQISKFIVDKLGDQVVGKGGLNSMGLTDWIMLSGGDPMAVAGFLTKKFFSGAGVQAKIAEMLSSGEAKGAVKPDIGPTKVLNLPPASGGLRSAVGSGETIRVAPKGSNIEMTGKTGITNTKQTPPQQPEIISKKSSLNTTTGGVKSKTDVGISESISKAKASGQSFDEWVKGQGETVLHGTADKFDAFGDNMKGSITGAQSAKGAIWFTPDAPTAKAYSVYAAESGPINKLMEQQKVLEKIAQKSGKNSDWAKVDKLTQEIDDLGGYDATYQRRLDNANVKEAVVKGDFLTVDAKGKSPQELSKDGNIDSWLNVQLEKARAMGKDGVVFKNLDDAVGLYDRPATHYAIFDSKNIKTRSQLKAEWDKIK